MNSVSQIKIKKCEKQMGLSTQIYWNWHQIIIIKLNLPCLQNIRSVPAKNILNILFLIATKICSEIHASLPI